RQGEARRRQGRRAPEGAAGTPEGEAPGLPRRTRKEARQTPRGGARPRQEARRVHQEEAGGGREEGQGGFRPEGRGDFAKAGQEGWDCLLARCRLRLGASPPSRKRLRT